MFFKLKQYIKYLLKSKNQYDVHSPFIYDFITKCLNANSINQKEILNFKKDLLANNEIITTHDLGAGSKIFKSPNRKVSKIAKHAGISNKYAFLLNKILPYFEIKNVLELGTSLGISTASMKIGNPNIVIDTIEGCNETAKIAQQYFDKHQLNNINLIIDDFKTSIDNLVINKKYDLVYFDGNHLQKPTLKYFNACLKNIHNNTIFIFDDIHWSKEMVNAWEIIKKEQKVTTTIDLFQWGIVFFRKELSKQHFIIRF